MNQFFEKTFHLKEHNTTIRTELLAGITTFLSMAYILAVNPAILSGAGMDRAAGAGSDRFVYEQVCGLSGAGGHAADGYGHVRVPLEHAASSLGDIHRGLPATKSAQY